MTTPTKATRQKSMQSSEWKIDGSKQTAHYRSNKFMTIFYCFNTQMLLVNLQRICLGGLGWSSRIINWPLPNESLCISKQNPSESSNKGDTCLLVWLYRTPSTLDSNRVQWWASYMNQWLEINSFCSTSKQKEPQSQLLNTSLHGSEKLLAFWLQSNVFARSVVHAFCTGVTFRGCVTLLLRRAWHSVLWTNKETSGSWCTLLLEWFSTRLLLLVVHNDNFI